MKSNVASNGRLDKGGKGKRNDTEIAIKVKFVYALILVLTLLKTYVKSDI